MADQDGLDRVAVRGDLLALAGAVMTALRMLDDPGYQGDAAGLAYDLHLTFDEIAGALASARTQPSVIDGLRGWVAIAGDPDDESARYAATRAAGDHQPFDFQDKETA
jgi:hypothetical protein